MSVLCLARARSSLAREAQAEAGRPSRHTAGRGAARRWALVGTASARPICAPLSQDGTLGLLKHNGLKSLIFEDSRPFTSRGGQRILSPARLPVPPLSPDAISIRYHTLSAAALLQFSQCLCYRDPTFHRALWLTQPGVWPPGIWAVPPCNASTARPEVSLWAGCSET